MLLILGIYFTLISLIQTSPLADDDGTLVRIEAGFIQGQILKSENGNDYWAFQEIPYAAPPVGENRFQPPKKPQPWDGILSTTKNVKQCHQPLSNPDLESSEDCLFLNVYSPVKPGSIELLPVLIWIHGGGFATLSGAFIYFGPQLFMDSSQVVVVTINYRLGPFGFLGTDDGVIPRNIGVMDQHLAIKWVNENINKFGGNNSHVILSGESAGSISVGKHLIGPWEDGVELFQGVIMQSGSAMHVISTDYTFVTNATEVALELARSSDPNFTPENTTELLNFLQKADVQDLLVYDKTVLDYINPEEKGPFQIYLDGDYKKLPALIGFNSEEWLFKRLPLNETELAQFDADPSLLISSGVNMSPENRTIAGALYKEIYTNGLSFVDYPGGYVRHQSDTQMFNTAVCKQVELGSPYTPHYFYEFSYKGEMGRYMDVYVPEGADKVAHSEDVFYMWIGDGNTQSKYSEADQLTSKRIVKMWINFIKYLNPTPDDDPLLENVEWLPSEPDTLRYLNINDTLEMKENPRQYKERKAILEKYMEPPYYFFE